MRNVAFTPKGDHIAWTQIKEILQHSKRDGQMVKSLTASLVSREEEERHQRNLNENEQLKKQIAESGPVPVRVHATHLR
ncbi:hypothetical protein RRG08_028179 [Elysia crispata]|uniref:Uncharacterized protein n=1 Tax=Elysia crispata TaxID=231223 RepID=A0AAE1CQT8_9GAST|nr:hypothetical protein RRG08_028179 [Elysia crispata]